MIIERDGKFFEKIEVEKEISELEFLKRKVKELEERINLPVAHIVICPYPCQKREEPIIRPWVTPNTGNPIWYYDPTQITFTCESR